MKFDEEQDEIVGKFKELRTKKGRSWFKFKGDVINRLIIDFLRPYVEPHDLSIVGPAAYIEDIPTEFDLLVVSRGAQPAPHTNCFKASEAKMVVEIKAHGFYFKKDEAVKKIQDYSGLFKDTGLKWAYITIAENETLWKSTKEAMRENAFRLSISPKFSIEKDAWQEFVNKVKVDLNILT